MENNSPKLTVLMPAYNAEKFIAEAIESILGQTFTDFEFIIINDGSTDNTAKIVRHYKDPRIVFIDNRENQGLVAVLNHGLDMARGEYIARMDADDIAYPERFAKQTAFMDAHPDVGVVSANVRIFDGEFGELGNQRNGSIKNPTFIGGLDWYRGCKVVHPAAMLRREVFITHNLRYDPEYTACEDYELWSRAVRYTKIANIQEMLLSYRRHNGSITARQHGIQIENTQRVKGNILNFCMSDERDRLSYRFFAGENEEPLYAEVRLFGFIPLFKIKAQRNSRKFFLFHFIPLVKIRKRKAYLFFIVPIMKIGEVEQRDAGNMQERRAGI